MVCSWKILFLETKVLYWVMICLTFSSDPYLIVQFFSFDSVKVRKATIQHWKKCQNHLNFILHQLFSSQIF